MIGPFAGPTGIVSLALDLDKSHTADFEFLGNTDLGWLQGRGFLDEGKWNPVSTGTRGRFAKLKAECLIHDVHPVAVAKRAAIPGLILRARGLHADVSRTIKKVTLRDAAGNIVSGETERLEIQAAFFNHLGTNSIAVEIIPKGKANRIPAGYTLELEETINVYEPSVAPADLFTCGHLQSDQTLERGQFIDSCNGGTRLWYQVDGNVVLYRIPSLDVLWQTGTHGELTSKLHMQSDGNLVLLNGIGKKVLFHSGTYRDPGASLRIQDNNDLVIYTTTNTALWRVGP